MESTGNGDGIGAAQGQQADKELPVAEITCTVQIVNNRNEQQGQTGANAAKMEDLLKGTNGGGEAAKREEGALELGKLEEEKSPKEDSKLGEEPRKRVRMVEEEGEKEEGEKKEGEEGKGERKSCVKDDNGFTYYKCRFCGLTFNFMTTLKAHERVHDIDTPYTCNKCGESFHFMCELEYHAKTHIAQKGYKCECGRTFFQYTDLLYHRHPGDDPPPEPSIPLPVAAPVQLTPSPSMPALPAAEFPTPEFMERGFEPKHQIRVWSDIRSKPYICQYCSKSYADSRGLAYHMYSHRGERMFNPRASRYLMCRNDNSYISSGVDLRDA